MASIDVGPGAQVDEGISTESMTVFLLVEGLDTSPPRFPVLIAKGKDPRLLKFLANQFPRLSFTFEEASTSEDHPVWGCLCDRGRDGSYGEEIRNVCLSAEFHAGFLLEADSPEPSPPAVLVESPPYPRYGESSKKLEELLRGQSVSSDSAAKPQAVSVIPPKCDRKGKKQRDATVAARMIDLIRDPSTHTWTAEQFRIKLGCKSRSTITATPAWTQLAIARESARLRQAEQAYKKGLDVKVDKRRRPKRKKLR